jgi:transposase, IS5 family
MRETRTAQTSLFDVYTGHKFGEFLQKLSCLLDERPEILALIAEDFQDKALKATGRKGLSIESVFRCMLLKQITGDSYEKLAFHLSDSSSYRSFVRLPGHYNPGKSALSKSVRCLQPQTLQRAFEAINQASFERGILDIEQLRIDSTVVKSNIAPPLDSQLLDDGIRVLSRLFAKSRDETGVKLRLTDYRKQSKSLAARIFYGKKHEKEKLYEKLIPLAGRVIKQSDRALDQVKRGCSDQTLLQPWVDKVMHYRQLLERVIDQAQRRVLQGEKVPATEKIYSLFEEHTDIIIKGQRDIEYGHKINLSTDTNGLITVLLIEEGNPCDTDRFIPVVEAHQSLYQSVPETTIADGGYACQKNIKAGKLLGVKRVGFHKKKGISLSEMGMKAKTLKALRNFRAGIEGNISELKRAFGASKATWKGKDGFLAYVWSSVISYNLTRLVRMQSG